MCRGWEASGAEVMPLCFLIFIEGDTDKNLSLQTGTRTLARAHAHSNTNPHEHFPVLIGRGEKGLRSAGSCLNFFLSVSRTPFVSVWFNTRLPPSGGLASSIALHPHPPTPSTPPPTWPPRTPIPHPVVCLLARISLPFTWHTLINQSVAFHTERGLMDMPLSRRPDKVTVQLPPKRVMWLWPWI